VPKALVTGGAGFIGSHVADRFLAAGYDVDVVDDLSSGKRDQVPVGATFFEVDVQSADVASLVRERKYDVIAHLAAQIDIRKSVKDPLNDCAINTGGTLNIFEAVRSIKPSRTRVVLVSTGGALYGEAAGASSDETADKNPDAPYGIAKLAAEYYTAYYSRIHGLDTAVLRLGNVYGPRQDPHGEAGVIAIFIGRILAGEPVTVFGDGEQLRDYVYVGDVAEALLAASTRPLPPAGKLDARAFNIGTGEGTSVLTLARELSRIAGRDPEITFAARRTGEIQISVLDVDKAAKVLGWKPRVALADGLELTLRSFQ
jgi:UDP-glucose 4-epimerase